LSFILVQLLKIIIEDKNRLLGNMVNATSWDDFAKKNKWENCNLSGSITLSQMQFMANNQSNLSSCEATTNALKNLQALKGIGLNYPQDSKKIEEAIALLNDPNFQKFNDANNAIMKISDQKTPEQRKKFSEEIDALLKNAKDCNDLKAIEDKIKNFFGVANIDKIKIDLSSAASGLNTTYGASNSFGSIDKLLGAGLVQQNFTAVSGQDICSLIYQEYYICKSMIVQEYLKDFSERLTAYEFALTLSCAAVGGGAGTVIEPGGGTIVGGGGGALVGLSATPFVAIYALYVTQQSSNSKHMLCSIAFEKSKLEHNCK
jgi:hypothetical protein